jgi:membrane protease YdiL (CAAX protease family)
MEKIKRFFLSVFYFPITRIVLGIVAITLALLTVAILFDKLPYFEHFETSMKISEAIVATIAYYFFYRWYERRKIKELSSAGIVNYVILGLAIGLILQSSVLWVVELFANYTVVRFNPPISLMPAIGMAISSGVIEEILIRGIIFRILEEWLGSWIALLLSALIFGFMHIGNEGASLLIAVSIAVEAGILLGAAYMYSRNLWLPIAIHFSWNFVQGGIYGARVSGFKLTDSLVNADITGSELITGGAFGPEGSIQALTLCTLAGIILLYFANKKGNFIQPFWKRS